MHRQSMTVMSIGIVAVMTTGFAGAADSPTVAFNPSGTYTGTVKCSGVPSAYDFDSGKKDSATLVIDGGTSSARLCAGPTPHTQVGDYDFVWLPDSKGSKGTLGFMGVWEGGPNPLDEIGQGKIDWSASPKGAVNLDADSTLFRGFPASASASCVWNLKRIATTTTAC